VPVPNALPTAQLPHPLAPAPQILFHNTGPSQVPALVCMELRSADAAAGPAAPMADALVHDPHHLRLVVLVNAAPDDREFPYPQGVGRLELHPELRALAAAGDADLAACGADDMGRVMKVPAQMSAVFVERRA
jgi:hypothetical protein